MLRADRRTIDRGRMKFDQSKENIQSKRDHSNFTKNEKTRMEDVTSLSCRNGGGVYSGKAQVEGRNGKTHRGYKSG